MGGLVLTKKQQDLLFVILIIIVFVFITITLLFIYNYKEAITSNPLSYGVKKMNLGQCSMSCFAVGETEPRMFTINSTHFSQIQNYYHSPKDLDINFTFNSQDLKGGINKT